MASVEVAETFASIQGESTFAGRPCFFVRLARCNLRCRYCDTRRAWKPGRAREVSQLAAEFRRSGLGLAEVTGGEPLLQAGTPALIRALLKTGRGAVLVETNGSLDIGLVPRGAVTIMDVKCPSSGAAEAMRWANIGRLKPCDEVKFVIGDRADYTWARAVVRRCDLARRCRAVLFSPARGRLDPARLAGWILRDRLPCRLNLQLHKFLGVP